MHLVFRKEPWLLELPIDEPIRLIGLERHFSAHKKVMERLLESSYCRKIICRALAVKECLLSRVKGSDISNKIVVIYGATPPKRISLEKPERDKVKLLFIGSANILAEWDFAIKGGPILLEAFRVLTQRYDNIELVVRSRVPQVFKERYSRLPRIRFFEHILSEERLKHEWMTADIFVMPSHVTPDAVFIEAMSYGLPVVTTDVWANPEIVEDGRTGFLIPNPGMAKFTEGYILHLDSPKFKQYINSIDYGMVESLVSKLTILIENGELRYRLSKAARWEVEHGKFSLKKRNEKLKKVLDEITNCADTF
jgi:glycosyltransferase involved in cell wall biosynthesis